MVFLNGWSKTYLPPRICSGKSSLVSLRLPPLLTLQTPPLPLPRRCPDSPQIPRLPLGYTTSSSLLLPSSPLKTPCLGGCLPPQIKPAALWSELERAPRSSAGWEETPSSPAPASTASPGPALPPTQGACDPHGPQLTVFCSVKVFENTVLWSRARHACQPARQLPRAR